MEYGDSLSALVGLAGVAAGAKAQHDATKAAAAAASDATASQDKAIESGERVANNSLDMSKEELAFQREQYEGWKSVYGPLQEDLGTYYSNLTGAKLSTKDLVEIQRSSEDAQSNIDTQLAQRGLSQSGLSADSVMRNQLQTAQLKANALSTADERVAQQQQGFLGLGLGQGSQMLGINAQVSNNGASNLMGLAQSYNSSAIASGNNAVQYGNMANNNSMALANTFSNIGGIGLGIAGANGTFGTGYSNMLQGGQR